MIGRWFIAFLVLFAALARAEEPPDQRPFLRIETGMHAAAITRITISADGRLLATGSLDKTVRLWSLPVGRLIKTFRVPVGDGDDGRVNAVALSPDGRLVAAAGWDAYRGKNGQDKNFIYLFDTVSGALTGRLGPLPNVVLDLAFSPDGRWLAAGLHGENGIRLWAGPGFAGAGWADPAADYGDSVYGIAFDGTIGRMAVTSYDGKIRLYQVSGGQVSGVKRVAVEQAPDGERPYGIASAPGDGRLAVGYADTTKVSVLETRTLKPVAGVTVDTGFAGNGDLGAVAWSADGATLFAGGRYDHGTGTNPVIAWGESGRGKPRPLGGPLATVMDLAALPQGGAAWGAAGPDFGLFGAQGENLLARGPATANMRGKRSGHFWSAADGTAVWFGLKQQSDDPWRFDVAKFALAAAQERPMDFIEPDTDRLKIENWIDETQPTLDAQLLQFESYETSRSLAIAPDGKSFILGTDWSIYRFDATGKQMWRIPVPGIAWGVNLSADGAILIAAFGDGTIRWYQAADGQELLAFFVHVPDKRWIAWTPTGYYAASPGGEDLIGWQLNGKTWDDPVDFFPASRFRDRFYRPDVVKLVLKTKDEAEAVKQADAALGKETEIPPDIRGDAPPVVQILDPADGTKIKSAVVQIKFKVRMRAALKLTGIEILIDGRPAGKRAAVRALEDGDYQALVEMPGKDIEVSILARAGERTSVRQSLRLVWAGEGTATQAKPDVYAVIVGVSDYRVAGMKLHYAAADAREFNAFLKSQAGRAFGKVHTILLTDDDATRGNVADALAGLEEQLASAKSEDIAFVFLSGYGTTDEIRKKRFYFLPVDAEYPRWGATAVSQDDLLQALTGNSARILLFIDTCGSGAALDEPLLIPNMTDVVNVFSQAQMGIIVFASSQGSMDCYEYPDGEHGAFARALFEGLQGAADSDGDGQVMTAELIDWLPARVKHYSFGRQIPTIAKPDTIPDFAIAQVGQ